MVILFSILEFKRGKFKLELNAREVLELVVGAI